MSNLVKTKRRINSVSSTRKITNAMELVASVKLKRFKSTMESGNNYVDSILNIIEKLNSNINHDDEFNLNKSNKRLFIIVNSNLGLCASYNNDLFKYASTILNNEDEIIPIGLKGYNHYKSLSFKLNPSYVALSEKINFDDINKFATFILSEFKANKYKSIHIIYMDYINTITYAPSKLQLLPIKNELEVKEDLIEPIIEPSAIELLNELEPIYVASMIYQAILTSQVSEQASRRIAMENATDNADDLIKNLKLEYNKARQGAITQEITEVVSGANNVNR